jgi:tetratricopeptide repeat protein 21B
MSMSLDYITQLNPDFMLELAQEYLQHCGTEPVEPGEMPSPMLSKGVKILESITRIAPGLLKPQLLVGRAKYIMRDIDGASRALNSCLQADSSFADAHIMMAQIYLHEERYKTASQSLEQALSHNFEVRDSPTYHLVKAKVLAATNQMEEALQVLEAAMRLPGIQTPLPTKPVIKQRIAPAVAEPSKDNVPTMKERVSVFLQLAHVHASLGHTPEAAKVIQDAMNEFRGTAEEIRVAIANSELALKRGDVQAALGMLKNVSNESP